VKIYIDRDTSSEYSATDLYEDWQKYMVEAEISEEDWLKYNKAVRTYWDWQDKLEKLFEAGRSTRGDK
jgi:tryptophan 2,3-dioxygenase